MGNHGNIETIHDSAENSKKEKIEHVLKARKGIAGFFSGIEELVDVDESYLWGLVHEPINGSELSLVETLEAVTKAFDGEVNASGLHMHADNGDLVMYDGETSYRSNSMGLLATEHMFIIPIGRESYRNMHICNGHSHVANSTTLVESLNCEDSIACFIKEVTPFLQKADGLLEEEFSS